MAAASESSEPSQPAPRGNHPSLAEFKAVAQPGEVIARRNSEHWAGRYLRIGSIRLSRLLLPTGISANGTTWMMIIVGILGAAVLILPGWWPFLACAVVMQLSIMIDCSDGEIARWRNQGSAAGVYIDRIGHYIVEAALPIGLGIHLDGGPGRIGGWMMIGLGISVLVLLKKSFGDLVHVARAYAGWPKLGEGAEVAAPRSGGLRSLRGMLRFFPFFRAFGAIEFSLILFVVATVDLILRAAGLEDASAGAGWLTGSGGLSNEGLLRLWTVIALPLAALTALGYLVSILSSSRLKSPGT
jgi:phosphatidylglycerophosphate synthase